jgi:2',3'-cyclic-nucleotide 2'-phosphodiesterase (5'-nucleotidase family)
MLIEVAGSWIVKAGAEATHAVITEITWSSAGAAPVVTTRLDDVGRYPENRALRERVDLHMKPVRELSNATLLRLTEGATLSSVGARSRQTSIGTLICSRLRDALGADVCLFNGGGIRGSRTYPSGRLTYGNIEEEVPFDNEVVVVTMEGSVLREVVAASRANAPAESGAFLQVDDRVRVDGRSVTEAAGAPLVLERDYRIAIVRELLLGLDRSIRSCVGRRRTPRSSRRKTVDASRRCCSCSRSRSRSGRSWAASMRSMRTTTSA